MSKLIDLNLSPDERTLRQFGWIALGGFGFLAVLAWQEWLIFAFGLGAWRGTVAGVFAGLAVAAALTSLVYPKANWGLYVGMTLVAYPIGFVLSYVIMGVLFYGMLAPVGLFFRLTGRDLLKRHFEPDSDSYWTVSRPPRPKEGYFRQF